MGDEISLGITLLSQRIVEFAQRPVHIDPAPFNDLIAYFAIPIFVVIPVPDSVLFFRNEKINPTTDVFVVCSVPIENITSLETSSEVLPFGIGFA